eukprot:10526845-Prorocentrum_lima.AAC.1
MQQQCELDQQHPIAPRMTLAGQTEDDRNSNAGHQQNNIAPKDPIKQTGAQETGTQQTRDAP